MSYIGIFLDRDGTINHEVNFLLNKNDLKLLPRSADAISEANNLGLKVIIVTNQSGIARGILTAEQLNEIHETLIDKLKKSNAHIDGIYYCPHHPDVGNPPYRIDCDCRKPKMGMLTKAAKEFNIELKDSFVIGDKMIDIQMGNNGNLRSILVLTGYGKEEMKLCQKENVHIDYIAEDLFDAIQYVKNNLKNG